MFLRTPRTVHYDYATSAMSSSECQVCFQLSAKVFHTSVCIDPSTSFCRIPRFIQCGYAYIIMLYIDDSTIYYLSIYLSVWVRWPSFMMVLDACCVLVVCYCLKPI